MTEPLTIKFGCECPAEWRDEHRGFHTKDCPMYSLGISLLYWKCPTCGAQGKTEGPTSKLDEMCAFIARNPWCSNCKQTLEA